MTVKELIRELEKFNQNLEVYVWDSANSVHTTTNLDIRKMKFVDVDEEFIIIEGNFD